MKQMVSYAKLSKKAKREIDSKRRGSWYGLSPVTRKPAPAKAYNRNREKRQPLEY